MHAHRGIHEIQIKCEDHQDWIQQAYELEVVNETVAVEDGLQSCWRMMQEIGVEKQQEISICGISIFYVCVQKEQLYDDLCLRERKF